MCRWKLSADKKCNNINNARHRLHLFSLSESMNNFSLDKYQISTVIFTSLWRVRWTCVFFDNVVVRTNRTLLKRLCQSAFIEAPSAVHVHSQVENTSFCDDALLKNLRRRVHNLKLGQLNWYLCCNHNFSQHFPWHNWIKMHLTQLAMRLHIFVCYLNSWNWADTAHSPNYFTWNIFDVDYCDYFYLSYSGCCVFARRTASNL